jgi:hypothetical protein
MRATLFQTSNEPGATVTVRAVLTEYGVPVAARAVCRAELTRPDNTVSTLNMSEVQPGVFEAAITALAPGIYTFRIGAEGKTLRGRPFTREQTLTGAIWRGGDNPPPTSKDDPNALGDRLCALIGCLLRDKGLIELLTRHAVNPDEIRRCLGAYCRKRGPDDRPYTRRLELEERVRAVVRDDSVLRAVMEVLQPELE